MTFEQFTGDGDNGTNVVTIDYMTYQVVIQTSQKIRE
jgi:hypothetical protein